MIFKALVLDLEDLEEEDQCNYKIVRNNVSFLES